MLELFHTPITVLHVVVCFMVMLVVLIQPGKSGGLGAALGGAGAQQIFGGRGAGNFLSRTTWIGCSVFFLTSITLAYISTSTGDSLQEMSEAARKRDSSPSVPVPSEPAPAEPAPTDTAAGTAPASDPSAGAAAPGPASGGESAPSDSKPQ